MPRVPQYEGATVRPQAARVSQDIRAPAGAFGADVGQALQQAGQQVGQVASLIDRRAQEQGREDAELQAFNAYSAASAEQMKLFYEGDTAIYQRRGGQAIGAANEAAVELRRIGEDTAKTLTSPYAKQAFDKLWLRHQDSELGAVSRHEAGQRREFRDQTTAGVLATSVNLATLRYNDPKEVENQIDIGTLAIRANTKGLPPEQVNAQVLNFTSGIHKAVVLRMATDNPLAAQKYYQEHADSFTADDNVALQRTLDTPVKRAQSRVDGEAIIREVTETKASTPEALEAAVEAVESGGRAGVEGPVTSNGQRAQGVYQVMPATGEETAKKLGIAWQPELMTGKTKEAVAYQRQIGRAYLREQLDNYGGNRTLALAAYNAGPGMVEDWINGTNKTGKNPELLRLGDPRTGETTDAAWAGKIPFKETRQYVARVEGKIRGGVQDNIDLTRADEIVRERFADDPEKQDLVNGHIQRQNSLREQARRDREQEAWRQGLAHIDAGGSVDNLPPTVLENLPPGRAKDLEARENARIRGHDLPDNPAEFNRLMTLSVTDREAFIAEDPTKWPLPNAVKNQLITRKGALMTQDAREEARTQDIRKALSVSKPLLLAAEMDTTPKEGTDAATKYEAFTTALMARLDEFKQKEGRRASDAEIMDISRDLLLPGRLSENWWPDAKKRAYEVMTPEDRQRFYVPFDSIPAAEKTDITAALGGRATNELVERVYAEVRRGNKAEVQRLIAKPAETTPNPFVPPAGSVVVPVR